MHKKIKSEILIGALVALMVPNIATACIDIKEIILISIEFYLLLPVLVIVLIVVIIKSIRKKKIYRGKLNMVLLISFLVTVAVFSYLKYDNYKDEKAEEKIINEYKECKKSCASGEHCPCTYSNFANTGC
ncbi:MAG TPA: hypothetical protein P5323_04395 [Candidatus Moranbacteria bacterium]|nr:hypothetical protein [Candidatus Moranbacteria bacterium]HRY28346.1 hypothetical protein [Candidatus Moranbacteria bacterium]HSA07934.1 hypothetical protein [Candidatus Moranbacteria bacterium]